MSYGVPPDPPPDDEVHVEGPGEFIPGVIKVGDFPPEAGPMFPGDDLPGYEPTGAFVDPYDYIEKSGLVAASGIEIQAIKNSTDIVRSSTHVALAEQIEAKRARLIYRDDGSSNNLYKVRLTGDAIVRNTVEKTRAEIVAGTNKIRDIDTKFIYNSTNARAYCTQEHDRLKYGDFSYSWSSPDDVAVGSRVALQMTSPYPTINTLVQVKSKTKTKDRPLYHYSGVGVAEFNLATVFRSGDLHFSQTQMNFFLDQVVRGNIVTIAASDYYYPANRRCDGTADEVEINAAIDKLDSESSGGTVVLSPGTFYLNAAITPTDKIVITGAGAKTVLDVSSDITGINIVSGEDNVMIKNLTIQYSGGSEIEKYLIDSEGNTTQVIGCAIDHPGSLGVSLGGNRCKLIENDFTGGKSSISTEFGTSAEFNNATTVYSGRFIAKLSDTKYVITFRDNGGDGDIISIIAEIDGTSISYGNESSVASSPVSVGVAVVGLSSTTFVVVYVNNSDVLARLGTVSGTSISFGSSTTLKSSGSSNYMDVDKLSDTKFIAVFDDDSDSGHGTSVVGTITGTSISLGSEVEFNTINSTYNNVAAFSETSFIVTYKAGGDVPYKYKVGSVSGTTITYGDEGTAVDETDVAFARTMSRDDSKFMVMFADTQDGDKPKYVFGTVSGTDVEVTGYSNPLHENTASVIGGSPIDEKHIIGVYKDTENSDYGALKIGTVIGQYITWTDPEYFVETASSYHDTLGNLLVFRDSSDHGYAQYVGYDLPNSFCIKSDGNNNIIGNNTIHGTAGKFIEVGIDSAGDLNTIASNTIDGDGQNKEYILHGINIRDDSNNNNVSSNNISGVEKVAVVMQGSNNKVSNIMAKDNGDLIDRGDCQAETSPMVEGETTPDTSNVTWERVAASDESITGYAGRDYVWKFTISSGGTQARIYMTDTLYTTADMHGLVPGLTYKGIAQVYTKATGGVAPEDINVSLIDSDEASAVADTCNPLTQGAWEEVEVELTLRDDATGVTLRFLVESADAVAGEYFYVGDVRLEPVGTHNEHEQQFVDYGTGTMISSNAWQNPFPA